MPLYEFQCPDCSLIVEDLVSSTVKTTECPRCTGTMERLFPLPAFCPAKWGDSAAVYSTAFGQWFSSPSAMDDHAEKNGYIHINEVGGEQRFNDFLWESTVEREKEALRAAESLDAVASPYTSGKTWTRDLINHSTERLEALAESEVFGHAV